MNLIDQTRWQMEQNLYNNQIARYYKFLHEKERENKKRAEKAAATAKKEERENE